MTSNDHMTQVKVPGFQWNETKHCSGSRQSKDAGCAQECEPSSLLISQLLLLFPTAFQAVPEEQGKERHLREERGFLCMFIHIQGTAGSHLMS